MRTWMGIGAWVALVQPVGAGVVANYQDDFAYPTPATGWSYLWNANGAIGTATNYVPLVPDGTSPARYETQDQTPDAFPDPAPGSSLSATQTTLTPGQARGQNAIERYVIVGYTLSAEDIAANGNQLVLSEYSFSVSATSADGISAKVYKNDTLLIDQPLPPGTVFSSDLPDPNGGPIPLGPFAAGDTLYVAIGSNGVGLPGEQNDTNDQLVVDYSISLVPEPGSAAVVALGAGAMLLRRRLRRQGTSRC